MRIPLHTRPATSVGAACYPNPPQATTVPQTGLQAAPSLGQGSVDKVNPMLHWALHLSMYPWAHKQQAFAHRAAPSRVGSDTWLQIAEVNGDAGHCR